MNRVVVGQAAAGLAAYLLDQGLAGGTVIIGHDARHKSDVFARDSAEIFAGAGFRALLVPVPTPTPVVAFGIGHFGCVAGVVVTASHNPPQDNGYKVYLGDGSQIVPPADGEIAARIEDVTHHDLVRRAAQRGLRRAGRRAGGGLPRPDRLAGPADAPARPALGLHPDARGRWRGSSPRPWPEPASPAPRWWPSRPNPIPTSPPSASPTRRSRGRSTWRWPWPSRTGADLVVANDPDADRCAIAAPIDGAWRMLRGDELGALLGDDALRRGVEGTYACSIVSSSLLAAMAAAHGQPFAATLTGFKWIGRVPGLAFGYEEAIGYCVDPRPCPTRTASRR